MSISGGFTLVVLVIISMKIKHLQEFISVAKSLNFTDSAQELYVSQPVLSRHIQYLEEKIGGKLFKRDNRRVELTSAGSFFLVEAEKIVRQYETSMSKIHEFTGFAPRKIAMRFLGDALGEILVPFVVEFQKKYTNITVDCMDSELDDALTAIENNTCDVSFMIRPNFTEKNPKFNYLYIAKDRLCAVVNNKHPIAHKQQVSVKELSNWPIIRINPENLPISNEYSTEFLSHYDIPYTLFKEYSNLNTCFFNLSFNNEVVLLMPTHRKDLLDNNIAAVEFVENDYWYEIELVWNKDNNNPHTHLIIEEFRAFLNNSKKIDTQSK